MVQEDYSPKRGSDREDIRAFIAFDLPDAVISAIEKLQQNLKRSNFKVSWVRADRIHLTLKFLGDIPQSAVDSICDVMIQTAAALRAPDLEAKGIGVFPGLKRPRVIWVGLAGQIGALAELQKRLDANLALIGYRAEQRPFKGHLTLGRVKGSLDSRKLAEAIRNWEKFQTQSFRAERLVLYKSELKPTGAQYTSLCEVLLT